MYFPSPFLENRITEKKERKEGRKEERKLLTQLLSTILELKGLSNNGVEGRIPWRIDMERRECSWE